ncbi:hypothetical protein [Streptomyces sp. YIM 121038]|uniref:hypothetical protein n=1 Tax=Streptomyces sp. YIM 121038 TaxID=2136401 RepID=UPI00110FFFCC|nr:hypothetical protein [Streptomyces sp. YIM 121038]
MYKYEEEKAIGGGYKVVATSDKIADPGRCITEVGKYLPDMHDRRRRFLHLKEDETRRYDDREVFVQLEEGVVKCPSQECTRLEENRKKPKSQRCEARVSAAKGLLYHYEETGLGGTYKMKFEGRGYGTRYLERGTCLMSFGKTISGLFEVEYVETVNRLVRVGYSYTGLFGEQKAFYRLLDTPGSSFRNEEVYLDDADIVVCSSNPERCAQLPDPVQVRPSQDPEEVIH